MKQESSKLGRGLSALLSGRENETVVDISSQSLDLPTKIGNRLVIASYTLKAVLCHRGATSSDGHYFTYAKHGNEWYWVNDLIVRLLTSDKVQESINTRHAYMYVFEQV